MRTTSPSSLSRSSLLVLLPFLLLLLRPGIIAAAATTDGSAATTTAAAERALSNHGGNDASPPNNKCRPLQLREWAYLLQTESESEFDLTPRAADESGVDPMVLLARAEVMWSAATEFEFGRGRRNREEQRRGDGPGGGNKKGGGRASPYVICKERTDGGGRAAGPTMSLAGTRFGMESGFTRRKMIRDEIRSTVASRRNDGLDLVHDKVVFRTLFNGDDILCGYALMDAAVADELSFDGCVVQPVLMAMKLMPRTVGMILDRVRECADEGDGGEGGPEQPPPPPPPEQDPPPEQATPEQEAQDNIMQQQQDDADEEDGTQQQLTVLETLLGKGDDNNNNDGNDDGGGRRPPAARRANTVGEEENRAASLRRARQEGRQQGQRQQQRKGQETLMPDCALDDLTDPTVDIILCPGSVASDAFESLREFGDGGDAAVDITQEMTDWVASMTGGGEEGGGTGTRMRISDEVYWTSSLPGGALAGSASLGGSVDGGGGSTGGGGIGGQTSSRAVVWRRTFDASLTGGRCADAYRTRLSWSVRLGGDDEDYTVVRATYRGTLSEDWERKCAASLLAAIAVRHDVCALELVPDPEVSNVRAQWMTQSGIEDERPFFDVGLDGEGQVVALSDTGVDVRNCYFYDANNEQPPKELDFDGHRKIAQYWPYQGNDDVELGHGTHTAATLVGKRSPDGMNEEPGLADGIAPAAKLAFVDISPDTFLKPPNDNELLSVGRNAATDSSPIAHIHSMSWGGTADTYYNNQARMFDNYMFDNDDFLVVIAAGNNGMGDKETSLATPAMAKNVLTVGASHSYGTDLAEGQLGPSYIADFSSRGPTKDGRMKPDLVAPGKYILSAAARPGKPGACDPPNGELPDPNHGSIDGLYSQAGTSMATPIVAGTAALVRQYFEEGWYVDGTKNSGAPWSVSGAMVKAVLMNGAQTSNMNGVDNGSKGVTPVKPYDNTIGYGRVSLTNSLYIAGKSDVQAQFWDREMISDGDDARTYDITIDNSNGCTSDQLSVTLAWTEGGATSGCTKCVLNDLDLYITEKGRETIKYFPNGRSSKDSNNNVERIVVDGAADGDTFTVHVDAYNLDAVSQKYALVATGCFGGIANELETSGMDVFSMDESKYVPPENNISTTMILIIVCAALGGLLLCCVGFACYRRRGKLDKEAGLPPVGAIETFESAPPKYDYDDDLDITGRAVRFEG